MKAKWREFCNGFKHVEDFAMGCLLRLDSQDEYSEPNSSLVAKVQFYAVEIARNREGCNDCIRTKFKPTPRQKKAKPAAASAADNGGSSGFDITDAGLLDKLPGNAGKELEHELRQIIGGQHPLLK